MSTCVDKDARLTAGVAYDQQWDTVDVGRKRRARLRQVGRQRDDERPTAKKKLTFPRQPLDRPVLVGRTAVRLRGQFVHSGLDNPSIPVEQRVSCRGQHFRLLGS